MSNGNEDITWGHASHIVLYNKYEVNLMLFVLRDITMEIVKIIRSVYFMVFIAWQKKHLMNQF